MTIGKSGRDRATAIDKLVASAHSYRENPKDPQNREDLAKNIRDAVKARVSARNVYHLVASIFVKDEAKDSPPKIHLN